jgi:glycosyltransferase involved in cell wall biosynthesis
VISTLAVLRWPSNVGYAIAPLERLFVDAGLRLAGGDARRVHMAYSSLSGGSPTSMPPGFTNVSALDLNDTSPRQLAHVEETIRAWGIDLVITFDMQPEHPVYRRMRQAGVSAIVSYWGAPMSSLMPAWKLAAKRLLLSLSRSRLDGLIFESRAMADFATGGRGVPERMIDIVPLGVDIERFGPARSDYVYGALDIPRDRKVAVFAGHCTPRKGIQTLVEAAIVLLAKRRRTDVFILVCGNTPEQAEPYEAMYRGMGIEPWIRFAGYRKDMIPIYQSAFCGVIPSSGWDSFPRSAIEMASTGLPVVASRLQGLKEAVLHDQTGVLFETGNAEALADAIERLLDDPTRAAALGRAGRARCERELNLATQQQRFLNALVRHLPADRVPPGVV